MLTLFEITTDKSAVLHEQAYKLCPELMNITQEELMFIICAYDYHSIYRQYPEEERVRKSLGQVYGTSTPKDDPLEDERVVDAIKAYKTLQYDPQREFVQTLIDKTNHLQTQLLIEEDAAQIAKINKTINELNKSIQEASYEIEKDMSALQIKGGSKLSFLEMQQMEGNIVDYREDVSDKVEKSIERLIKLREQNGIS